MKLSSNDGIKCDMCAAVHKLDFTYYSFDFRLVSVIANSKPSLQSIFLARTVESLDVCQLCYGKITDLVCSKYLAVPTGVRCDLSGSILSGTFKYYHCNIVRVDVKMSDKPFMCARCNTPISKDKQVCKCGGTDFTRAADTVTYDRCLELDVSEDEFKNLVDKAVRIRSTSDEWSTNG